MHCRSCHIAKLVSILPLGKLPLANRLLQKHQLNEKEPRYNLELMLCTVCGLVQLKDLVSPKKLFTEYLYFSSNSDTMVQSAAQLVEKLSQTLPTQATVIEIASNDGYLLQHYVKKNTRVLGIEPAKNIAAVANAKMIPTRCAFFNAALAQQLNKENCLADIIHANNVMAHIPDVNDFVQGLKILLKDTGLVIIEVPYLLDLIEHCEFDTIYHEHVYYFSLTCLKYIFEKQGLCIVDVEKIAMHGGSLRVFIKHAGAQNVQERVTKILEHERAMQLHQASFFSAFLQKIQQLKLELLELLTALKASGQKIAAYGASAKGATLLNYFGIDQNLLDFVVDRSPAKQGFYMPGVQLPIYAPEELLIQKPDYALLLTWNFAEEILAQQTAYRACGRFIIPIPQIRIC